MSRILRACAAAALAALFASMPARGEGDERHGMSVAASNGVVVHGVERGLLAARVREIDGKMAAGEHDVAARELADLASADLTALLEDGQGTYVSVEEAVQQRVTELPPPGLAAYRRALDARAQMSLDHLQKTGDSAALAREAPRFVHTTLGQRLLVALADVRLGRGDLDGATRALEDALRARPAADAGGVPRAAVVSRLAAILAASGDEQGVRALAAELPAEALAGPSPARPSRTMKDELDAAAALARRNDPTPPGPSGPLRVAAQIPFGDRTRAEHDLRRAAGEVQHPLPIGTPDLPVLLTRLPVDRREDGSRASGIVVAAIAATESGLKPIWSWPPRDVAADMIPPLSAFAASRLDGPAGGGAIVFPWPVLPTDIGGDDSRQTLVVVSADAEGKLADRRGDGEQGRSDGELEFHRLSFVGKPTVAGDTVYVSLVGHAEGTATQLHVARFDVVPAGAEPRLRLRWRRHVLDGNAMPPAQFHSTQTLAPPYDALAIPSSPLVRAGRVFVCSNTGAVACLDAATGRPEWIETYERYGPAQRMTVRETETRSWDDSSLAADGPWLFAAPRDSESLLQFRRAPRGTRTTLVEAFPFSGPSGSASKAGRLLMDTVPDHLVGVVGGSAYLSGRVGRPQYGALAAQGSPLVLLSLATRASQAAQVQEFEASGAPCLVAGALFFPTRKSLYRVPLADFEKAVPPVWTVPAAAKEGAKVALPGDLVPDGTRLWSVSGTGILLLESAK